MTSTRSALKDKIDKYLEPEEPEEDEPYAVEIYRGVTIRWYPTAPHYRGEILGVATAFGDTLTEVKIRIDEVLDSLEPDEEPPSGLFAQVVAEVKAWVRSLMPGWVREWGQNLYTTVNNIVENITNVYNDLREYTTKVINETYEYVTNVYKTFKTYLTEVYNNTYEYLTQNITNITENITNIIGVTQEALDTKVANLTSFINGKLAEWDSTGFLANPLIVISGVFAASRLAAEHDVVESFLEGFEEGLEE